MAVSQQHLVAGDMAEMERLRLQARVWEADAGTMLERIGVRHGWKCADLGCGAMGILGALSRRVGSNGEVLGIENDPRQLRAARDFIDSEEIANAQVLEADAYATKLAPGHFDLTHSRFLMSSHGRDQALLAEMIRITKPGGVVAIQEPDASAWNTYPGNILWSLLKSEILAAIKRAGGDFDAGVRTRTMLQLAGLQDVQMRAAVLPVTGNNPYKRLPLQLAWSLRRRILEGGRVNEAQLDRTIAECERIASDPTSMMMTFIVTQVWGRKPG